MAKKKSNKPNKKTSNKATTKPAKASKGAYSGDKIMGEKLIMRARKVKFLGVVPGSGRHRRQSVEGRGGPAECIVDIEAASIPVRNKK